MKKAEIALVSFVLLSLVLRVSSLPGSPVLAALSCSMLALFYLLFSLPYLLNSPLTVAFREPAAGGPQPFDRFWAIASGLVFGLGLLGILFVLNYWQGAFFFWCLGMFFLTPVATISLGKHWMSADPFYKAVAIRAGVLLLAGIVLVVAQM